MCGEKIEPRQRVYQINQVEFGPRGGVTEHGAWGLAHESCFLKRTGGRSLVPYLKRIAKTTKPATTVATAAP